MGRISRAVSSHFGEYATAVTKSVVVDRVVCQSANRASRVRRIKRALYAALGAQESARDFAREEDHGQT